MRSATFAAGYVAATLCFAAPPVAGEPYVIDVVGPHGAVRIETRYVPPGRGVVAEPPSETPSASAAENAPTIDGFFLGAYEVTQGNLAAVLGQEALGEIHGRLLENDKESGIGPEYPAFGVTIEEAVRFCRELEELVQESGTGQEVSLETKRVRLPSHDEWRYSCRGITDPSEAHRLPHFNRWPLLQDVPADIRRDCEEYWSEKGPGTPFDGSQVQVIQVVEGYVDGRRGVEILSGFLSAATGVERDYSLPSDVRPADSGSANDWGLKNMHGNIAEWTMAKNAQSATASLLAGALGGARGRAASIGGGPDAAWTSLLSDGTSSTKAKFFLVGGAFNISIQGVQRPAWKTFSIWGADEMKGDEPVAWTVAQSDENTKDRLPGFRILIDRTLAQDWLFLVRRDSTLPAPPDAAEIGTTFAAYRANIGDLASGDELTAALRRLEFFESIAHYRAGVVGADVLKDEASVEATDQEALFVHCQRRLMATDASVRKAH